jgi:hypothetical protein
MSLDDLFKKPDVWSGKKKKIVKQHCKDRNSAASNPCKEMTPNFGMRPGTFGIFAKLEQTLVSVFPDFYKVWNDIYNSVYCNFPSKFDGHLINYNKIFSKIKSSDSSLSEDFLKKAPKIIKNCGKKIFTAQYLDDCFVLADFFAGKDVKVASDFVLSFYDVAKKFDNPRNALYFSDVLSLVGHVAQSDVKSALELFKKSPEVVSSYMNSLRKRFRAYIDGSFGIAKTKSGKESADFFLDSYKKKYWEK